MSIVGAAWVQSRMLFLKVLQVIFGRSLKSAFASIAAEIVDVTLVLRFRMPMLVISLHTTNYIPNLHHSHSPRRCSSSQLCGYSSLVPLSLKEFATTLIELDAIAIAARIGCN